MPTLNDQPTLPEIQKYVQQLELERGFDHETIVQKCLLLGEEIGELFKAVRKSADVKTDKNSKIHAVEDELADVIIVLCTIANRLNIDLEKAFRNKEKINHSRTWQ